jgi:hypothetical protein
METILLTIERDDTVVARKQPVESVAAALEVVRREFQQPCGEFWVTIKNDADYRRDELALRGDTTTDTLTLIAGANSPSAWEALTAQIQLEVIKSVVPYLPDSEGIVIRRGEQ